MTLRPDAQAFDEVRIITVPRWKDSELSGSEWRISAHIEFLRNGKVEHTAGFQNIEKACGFLFSEYHRATDDGKANFGSCVENICDQEGCASTATVKYRLKHSFCREGHKDELGIHPYRQFCGKHKGRGDCGLEDADRNYEVVT